MFNSVKKVNISAANIRTNFQISKYFCTENKELSGFLYINLQKYIIFAGELINL